MRGKLISVLGVRGSMGATTLALNHAFLLQKLTNKKVLLFDFDFAHMGDIAKYLKSKDTCLAMDLHVLAQKKVSENLFDGFIPKHPKGIYTLQAFSEEEVALKLDLSALNQVFDLLLAHFDYVILDAGAQWTPFHLQPFLRSSLLYLTTNAEATLLQEAKKAVLKLIKAYVEREKIFLCMNRTVKQNVDTGELRMRLEDTRWFILPDVAGSLQQASITAMPLVLHDVRSAYTQALEAHLNETICQKDLPEATQKSEGDATALQPAWVNYCGMTASGFTTQENFPVSTTLHAEWDGIKHKILKELLKVVDFKGIEIGKKRNKKDEDRLHEKTEEAILQIINNLKDENIPAENRKLLVTEVLHEALGLGPLEALLADSSISEIMINGRDQIFIEQKGKLTLSPLRFSNDEQLYAIIERIVAPIGRRVDESTPLVDARLPDGSRVNIIIPPLSLVGPVVTIRRFSSTPPQASDLIGYGSMTESMAAFLKICIEGKLNIIVSGGTGSGKTTLLNVLSSFIPSGDRIVTIEDAAELQLNQDHVISLETRPPNIEGKGEISIRTLLKNSLRMRPDRIVVGECRGGEALDMLQAMNTGHDGSLTTLHSNSPRDCIARLETLVMYAGVPLPSKAIRSQIASAVHLIVQLNRLSDGSRKITRISEITGMEGEIITLQDIFLFEQRGLDKNLKVVGEHKASGFIPRFIDSFEAKGITFSRKHFQI